MRRNLLVFCAAVLVLWGAWWWAATTGLRSGVTAWFDARRAEGWQAEATVTRAGFPMRIGVTLERIALDDPATASALRLPAMFLSSPIYWPGHATVMLPDAPIALSAPLGQLMLTTTGATAALRLRPGSALELEAVRGRARTLALDLDTGPVLSLSGLRADITQQTDPSTYTFALTAEGLTPGALLRGDWQMPAAWPPALSSSAADMTVTFDRPWDRRVLEDTRPQPRIITLHRAEAVWGDLRLALGADLTVDAAGLPSGVLRVEAENWKTALDIATAAGVLQAGPRPGIENVLTLLSGDTDRLTLDIAIDRGEMRLGFVPLGRAPRIILR